MSFGSLIEKFRSVALDRIEQMNVLLVGLERDPGDDEATEELLREIHTLKGEAKMMGFADVNLVSHQTEHLLILMTEKRFDVGQDAVDVAFEGLDIIRQLLTKSAGTSDAPVDLAGFVERVNEVRNREEGGETDAAPSNSEPQTGDRQPEPDPDPNLAEDSWVDAAARSHKPRQDSGGFRRPGSGRSTRTRIDAHTDSSEVSEVSEDGTQRSSDRLLRLQAGGTLRVDLQKLERLGNIAGEVMLMSRRLNYELGDLDAIRDEFRLWLERVEPHLPLKAISGLRSLVHRFDDFTSNARDETYRISSRTSQLDEEVRTLRHVPLAQVMSHYPRAVRDLAREQGKRVRLVHSFGNVEVDRLLLSALSEPMLHMIRNAVDHGIESPQEREASGKEPEAEIQLLAEYVGDSIRVVIQDDGRGIDPQIIRQKAVSRDLMPPERAEALSDQEALALIFEPGFSTRESVSDVSGRGIGMDVVRRQITELGGYIEVESEVGEGTSITLILPVSSAVSDVLMIDIAGKTFALAAKEVVRVDAISRDKLMEGHGGVFLEFDGEMIALHDWTQILEADGERSSGPTMTVLILKRGSQRVAVWVDQVLGEREAMNRPFGEFLGGVRLCRGVALTDAGEVVPLLNVSELFSRAQRDRRLRPATVGSRKKYAQVNRARPAGSQTVLVVEDSEITRDLVTGILRSHGYHYIVAEDGYLGWKMLQDHRVDMVVTDIQMPRMDGLELLQRIRASEQWAELPVVILTTLGDPEDKERAMDFGADGYLVKLNFQESDLVGMVRRYLNRE
jgi:chemotaxis protein histidine kinase CheA/CheY-like chemotaxis protein